MRRRDTPARAGRHDHGVFIQRNDAAIVKLFGTATVTPFAQSPLAQTLAQQSTSELKAPRQVIEVEVERTITTAATACR